MLSTDPIVQVNVFATAGAASPTAYDTGLILYPKEGATADTAPHTYTSAADMLSDGYTSTEEAYQAAVKYFAANPSPTRLLVYRYPNTTSNEDALSAALESTASFYGIYLCDHTAAKVKAMADYVQSLNGRYIFFYSVTGTPAEAIAQDGLFAYMQASTNMRALGIYARNDLDAASVMGTALGLSLTGRNNAFSLCYKQINGMEAMTLTESQVTSIKALNGNVYVARGYSRYLLENGSVASGLRFDEVLYLDRIASELQDAAIALLTETSGKMSQTDDTTAIFINRFSTILSAFTDMGVLATSAWRGAAVGSITPGDMIENGFTLWADSFDNQSDADRAAHKAMPVHAALCFAGSVESLVLDIDVTV